MASLNDAIYEKETIELRLPERLTVTSGVNCDGDWICKIDAVTTNVETGQPGTFGNTVKGGDERATRREMAALLAAWFHHEMLEQLGCSPPHYDGPDEDD